MVDDNTKEILKDIRDNTSNIQVTAEPPVGGATEAKQDDIIAAIQAIPGGGGTQYTEADTDASITGTALMWEDTGDTLRPVSTAKPLPVSASIDTTGLATSATDTNTATIAGAVSGTEMQVDVVSSALPTGASTSANQTTMIGHLDGVEGLLTTIDADTGNVVTSVQLLDDAVATTASAIPSKGIAMSGTDGTNARVLKTDTSGELQVDVLSISGVSMSNAAIQSTGDEAHDAVDAGNPMKIGGRAQEPTAAPDEVADNDRVDTLHDRVGRVAVYQGYPRWYAAINASTSGNNTIKAAAGVGKKIVVTSVSIISDGTVDIRWESGADGTALSGQMPLLVNTGYSASDPNGLFETAANTLLNLELSGAVNVHGHIAGMIIDD